MNNSFFGVGFMELFTIAVIALIVLGPERLPATLREIAKFIRQVRNLTNEFTSQFGDDFKALEDLNPRKLLQETIDSLDKEEEAQKKGTAKPNTTSKPTTSTSSTAKSASTPAKPVTPKPATVTTAKTTEPKITEPKTTEATNTASTTGTTTAEGAAASAPAKTETTPAAAKTEAPGETPVAAASSTDATVSEQSSASTVATTNENHIEPPALKEQLSTDVIVSAPLQNGHKQTETSSSLAAPVVKEPLPPQIAAVPALAVVTNGASDSAEKLE